MSVLEGISEDKVASLQVPSVRFARARPETLEISSDHRVPGIDGPPKQIINVDKVYRTSIHSLTSFKDGSETVKVDPKHAVIYHYRIPGRSVAYEQFDFNDPQANTTDDTLQKDMPALEAAIATRFNMQVSSVKGFLKKLAQRYPPDADTAAATHNVQ